MIRNLISRYIKKDPNPIWNNLTENEKRAIHDPRDYPIMSVLKVLSKRDVEEIYNSIRVKDEFKRHYLLEQKVWIEDARWYMGLKKKREISDVEIADEILKKNLHKKYRAHYAAKFRSNVELSKNSRLTKFLSLVDAEYTG